MGTDRSDPDDDAGGGAGAGPQPGGSALRSVGARAANRASSSTSECGPPTILAYGGVVWEHDARGRTVVAVVHRPRYDDWSFPKGKGEPGEEATATAVREVEEETGLSCTVGGYLGEVSYSTDSGARKVVGYWSMQTIHRQPRPPDAEVDLVDWWTVEDAADRLTHPQDRDLLERFTASAASAGGATAAGIMPAPSPTTARPTHPPTT